MAPAPRRPALLFDRDGTLNVDHGYTWKPEDLVWQPGAREAIGAANAAGWLVVVVTNQSGVARGLYGEAEVDRFHARMQQELAADGARIDAFYSCPYHEDAVQAMYRVADHPDRKPGPGMVRRAILEHRIDRDRAVLFGDHVRDVEAAAAAGVRGVLVRPGELRGAVEAALTAPVRTGAALAPQLAARAATSRTWLFDHAFPRWAADGFDARAGLFHERLGVDGAPDDAAPRRVRVQARQTYAFAAAGRLGWSGPWAERVEQGLDVLLGRAIRADGGVRHLLGAQRDERRDLYDTAFVLFGLAHAARARPARAGDCFAAADALLGWLDAHWTHPAGGYREGEIDPQPPRRQNPHMHLLEALLALDAAAGEGRYRAQAAALGALFRDRLFEPRRGVLPELFADDWTPQDDVVEPGHHFEWRWLLGVLARAGGPDLVDRGERLRIHAEVYGVDADGFACDAVRAHGGPHRRSARLWPQTERLKANLAAWEATSDEEAARAAAQAFDALMAYCAPALPGLWRDRRIDGAFIDEPAPASSFYHIVLALEELIRVAG
jgi:mannose-6-phosphate isomerase